MPKKKILIIEDEPYIAKLIKINLELDGYETRIAENGKQGLELVEEEKPDLIVLDIMLPFIDGWEIARRLRSSSKYKDLPILALTAKAQDLDINRGYSLGIDAYVTKPFEPRHFLDLVKKFLQK